MPRYSNHIHNETRDQRIRGIDRLILDMEAEIAELRSEKSKLQNGEISLRSLGLERGRLYPLWRAGLRTAEDVESRIKEKPENWYLHISGLGKQGATYLVEKIAEYRQRNGES